MKPAHFELIIRAWNCLWKNLGRINDKKNKNKEQFFHIEIIGFSEYQIKKSTNKTGQLFEDDGKFGLPIRNCFQWKLKTMIDEYLAH